MATKNITVSVDTETHHQARILAAEMGTSVSALVREYLRNLSSQHAAKSPEPVGDQLEIAAKRRENLRSLLAEWKSKGIGLQPSEKLTREEFYEQVMKERGLIR